MFGCAWKIKFSGKAFQLTVCFMALTRKLVYISIFSTNHFWVSDVQREREGERERERVTDPPKTDRTPASAPPSRSHHHRDRTLDQSHPTEIASSSKTDPPKIDLFSVIVTHDRSRRPWPVTDLSLSLNFWLLSLPPSLNLTELWSLTNGVVLIFVFLSLYIEIFYYKICLVAEKIGEKIWESSRKITFSKCNQTQENIF